MLGGEKQVHIVKLDALLRRIFAATVLKSTKSLDFTLEAAEKMKRQKTSIRRAVEREDEDLASKFTPQDLNAAISRAVVEISKEQEHLDVVTHVVAGVERLRRLRRRARGRRRVHSATSTRGDVLARDVRSRLSQSIPGIRRNRRCVGQIRVDIPEALHASVMELEFVLFASRIHQTRDG